MDKFVCNLELLKKTDVQLYTELSSQQDDVTSIAEIKNNNNGCFALRIATNSGQFNTNSMYSPEEEAKLRIQVSEFKKDVLFYCVIGYGLGYYVEALIEHIPNNAMILVIEPRMDILYKAYKLRNQEKILTNPRVKIITRNHLFENKLYDYFVKMVYKVKDLEFLLHPNYQHFMNVKYADLRKQIYDSIYFAFRSIGDSAQDTMIGIRNIFRNLPLLINNPIINVKQDFKTAVVVSAGPSLDKNIEQLKEYNDQVFVITGMTALQKLKDMGIRVDAVVNVERDYELFELLFSKVSLPENTIFIGTSVTDDTVLNSFDNKKFLVGRASAPSEYWIKEAIEDYKTYEIGTTVAHLCYSFSKSLGVDNIIFMGQDLSYNEKGENHTSGTLFDEESSQYNEDVLNNFTAKTDDKMMLTEGYYGGEVKTNKLWFEWLKWFERQFLQDTINIYNATEGGANIKGALNISFKEAIARCELHDATEPVEIFLEPSESLVTERTERIKRTINQEINQVKKLIDKAEELSDEFKRLKEHVESVGNVTHGKIQEHAHKINDFRTKMYNESIVFYFTTQMITLFNLIDEMDVRKLQDKEEIMKWFDNELQYFSDIMEIGRIFVELYDEEYNKFLEALEG